VPRGSSESTASPEAAGPAADAPTVADSAAAAREDVSPEWKRNERSMGPYDGCMAQATAAPEAERPRLEAACARLPSAPR
jgi:hypothetical protein